MTETMTIESLDREGGFASIARLAESPRAAIVVIPGNLGINAGIRRKCDRLAEAGYLALAPDLF